MATAVEFRSPADAFPLGSVFETLPGSTVELERLVARETRIIPYLWVRGTTADDIEVAFTTHAGLTDIRLVDSVEDEYLLRAEWDRAHVGVLEALVLAYERGYFESPRGSTLAEVAAHLGITQ
jgi:hypothetical protein